MSALFRRGKARQSLGDSDSRKMTRESPYAVMFGSLFCTCIQSVVLSVNGLSIRG